MLPPESITARALLGFGAVLGWMKVADLVTERRPIKWASRLAHPFTLFDTRLLRRASPTPEWRRLAFGSAYGAADPSPQGSSGPSTLISTLSMRSPASADMQCSIVSIDVEDSASVVRRARCAMF